MRSLLRILLVIGAFVAGCQAQNWVAIDTCLEHGGQWKGIRSSVPGGVCVGVPIR
jgi:hypothetical protein